MTKLLVILAATCAFYTFTPLEAKAAGEFNCSDVSCLIAAMDDANTAGGATTINLDPGTYTLSAVNNAPQFVANGLPVVISELTINGVDSATTIIERDPAAPQFGIFDVAASASLTLNGLTVKGGSSGFRGGGIRNAGTLNVSHSIIENNRALDGGGIANSGAGTLNITHTILVENSAHEGGGIFNSSGGTAVIAHSSILANGGTGGGGFLNMGTMTIQDSTIDRNVADGGGGGSNFGVMEIKNTTIANNRIRIFAGAGVSS